LQLKQGDVHGLHVASAFKYSIAPQLVQLFNTPEQVLQNKLHLLHFY